MTTISTSAALAPIGDLERGFLNRFLRQHSYKTGHFVLRSGKESHEFLNVKTAVCRPDGADMVGLLVNMAVRNSVGRFDAVAGVIAGGIPIANAVSAERWRMDIMTPSLLIRKETKDHGTGQRIEGLDNLDRSRRKVLIVEDVWTTGASTDEAIQAVMSEKVDGEPLEVAGVVTVVDRCVGAVENLRLKYLNLPLFALTTLDETREAPIAANLSLEERKKIGVRVVIPFKYESLVSKIIRIGFTLGDLSRKSESNLIGTFNGWEIDQIRLLLACYGMNLASR